MFLIGVKETPCLGILSAKCPIFTGLLRTECQIIFVRSLRGPNQKTKIAEASLPPTGGAQDSAVSKTIFPVPATLETIGVQAL